MIISSVTVGTILCCGRSKMGSADAPIFVAGGTGNCGSACVRALSAQSVRTRVYTRDTTSKKAQALAELPGVSLMEGDFADTDTLTQALQGCRAAFVCCSNSKEQVQLEKDFIDAVAKSSCGYLVRIGTCGVEGYTSKDSEIEYARIHAEVEEYLAKTTVNWTVLHPNYFMQNHMGDIMGTLPKNIVVYPFSQEAKANVVDTRDVGEVAAALLRLDDPSKHFGQHYDVCGPEALCTSQLAALYTTALEGRAISALEVPRDAYAEGAKAAGFPDWLAVAVATGMDLFWGKGKMAYASSPAVMELSAPKRTMEAWIQEHIALTPSPESTEA
eukprot:TRINITY_DN40114_c0_g1_i1.p1 TRINITY_DN40114_c0_g1~~TRINITY_DN40114_c0_g1_i1.p1  ORF type:complete len:329 (+),score=54.05 TRINITY_DN40114_c0_g1_i1:3-989(+)